MLPSPLPGKDNLKGTSSKGGGKPAGSQKDRRFVSGGDESDAGVSGTNSKAQLSAKPAPLSAAAPTSHRSKSGAPGTAKGKRQMVPATRAGCRQDARHSLRSAKPLPQDKHLTAELSSKEMSNKGEGEDSSEDMPLSIKRKNKLLPEQETQHAKPPSTFKSSQNGVNKVSSEQRTVKRSAASQPRQSRPKPIDGSNFLNGKTTSTGSSTSHLPEKPTRATSRINPPRYLLESDTELESGEEEIHVKEKNSKVSDKKPNCKVSKTAMSGEPEREKVWKALELFPRAADGWSEKELQKLYRQVVALASAGKVSLQQPGSVG